MKYVAYILVLAAAVGLWGCNKGGGGGGGTVAVGTATTPLDAATCYQRNYYYDQTRAQWIDPATSAVVYCGSPTGVGANNWNNLLANGSIYAYSPLYAQMRGWGNGICGGGYPLDFNGSARYCMTSSFAYSYFGVSTLPSIGYFPVYTNYSNYSMGSAYYWPRCRGGSAWGGSLNWGICY